MNKKGIARTPVEILIDGEMFETDVKIYGQKHFDWEFEDDDIQIEDCFENYRDMIIRKVRIIENRLTFTIYEDQNDHIQWEQFGI